MRKSKTDLAAAEWVPTASLVPWNRRFSDFNSRCFEVNKHGTLQRLQFSVF
jgi:hypothetical protein